MRRAQTRRKRPSASSGCYRLGRLAGYKRPSPACFSKRIAFEAAVQERYLRLASLQEEMSWSENQAFVDRPVEVLVADHAGRKDGATARRSGRARDNRLVHFTPGHSVVRPGDVVTTLITQAAPHHLIADGPLLDVRRTRAGDAWAASRGAESVRSGVLLGLPRIGAPAG